MHWGHKDKRLHASKKEDGTIKNVVGYEELEILLKEQ